MNQCKWVRKTKNGLNVVFIHGINSGESCWRNKNGSFWPKLLENESELEDVGIYIFSYRTGINTGSYSLSDIVDSLREYFILDDLIKSLGVIFVCHSMGGIVTRRFLVKHYSMLVERELNKIGLFLVASPSLGSEYANMLGLVSSIMGHTQASALKFSQDNVWLNDLDKDFINLKTNKNLQIEGKELIEDLPLHGKGFIRRQVVEPFSGAKYFGNSFKVPGSDHCTIAAPADRKDVQHRLLVQFIKEFTKEKFGSLESTLGNQLSIEEVNLQEDKRLLQQLKVIFERPAFRESCIHELSISELITAIDDTQAALNTGKLYSRSGNLLGEFSSYLEFRTSEFQTKFKQIVSSLQKVKKRAKVLFNVIEQHMDMSKYHFGCSPRDQIICCCIDCIKDNEVVQQLISMMDDIDKERNEILDTLRSLGLSGFRRITLSSVASKDNSWRWER